MLPDGYGSKGAPPKFCSKLCRTIYRKKPQRLIRCELCGGFAIESRTRTGKQKFCSSVCRNRAGRDKESYKAARKARFLKRKRMIEGVMVETVRPKKVFLRDGYRCQHCGIKTRPDFNSAHTKYPNLDHIIPLSLGGEHSYRNCQTLCAGCNRKKGNNLKREQLRLC